MRNVNFVCFNVNGNNMKATNHNVSEHLRCHEPRITRGSRRLGRRGAGGTYEKKKKGELTANPDANQSAKKKKMEEKEQ